MTQGNFVSEDTNSLIRRAQQTLGEVPVLDLTNWQSPTFNYTGSIRSLAGSCHSIKVKNVVTVTDSSIVKCTGTETGTCGAIPATCDLLDPTTPNLYYNFVATVNALVTQPSVDITFKYVLDGVPMTEIVSTGLIAGSNTIYAFATNQQYVSGTELVLYGAEATNY